MTSKTALPAAAAKAGALPADVPGVGVASVVLGDLARLGHDGAIVKKSFADKHHLHVGSIVTMTGPSGRRLTVRGARRPRVADVRPHPARALAGARLAAGVHATFPRPSVRYRFVG